MIPSLHDNLIVGYEVDCENRTIKFNIRRPNWSSVPASRRLILSGVVGYHLKDDAFSNIIMSIEVVPIDDFVREYGAEIADSFKESGALEPWALDQ